MKTLIIFFTLSIFCFLTAQENKAFLVGIGNYDEAGKGWSKLHSQNDVPLLQDLLVSHFDFKTSNIDTLTQENATYDNVTTKLRTFISKLKKGDNVLFMFSGHGQQIQDEANGDEQNEDGLDEALVLFDTPFSKENATSNYKGEKHLKDDELRELFKEIRIRIKPGGELLVLIDACHSGNLDKFDLGYKGTDDPFIFTELTTRNRNKKESEDERINEFSYSENDLSPMVMMTSSESNILSREYEDFKTDKKYGGLNFFFVDYMKKNSNNPISYKSLYQYIRGAMKNTPQLDHLPWLLENGDVEREVFLVNTSFQFPENDAYFLTANFNSRKSSVSEMKLPVGKMHGFDKGSLFDLVNRKNGQSITKGKILEANQFESILVLDKSVTTKQFSSAAIVPKRLGVILSDHFKVGIIKKENKGFAKFLKKQKLNIEQKEFLKLNKSNLPYQLSYKKGQFTLKNEGKTVYSGNIFEAFYNELLKASFKAYFNGEVNANKNLLNEDESIFIHTDSRNDSKVCFYNGTNRKKKLNLLSTNKNEMQFHIPTERSILSDMNADITKFTRAIEIDKNSVLDNVIVLALEDKAEVNNLNMNIFASNKKASFSDFDFAKNILFPDESSNLALGSEPFMEFYVLNDCKGLKCQSVTLGTCAD